jgi:CubicO group peptidase (beta-lactamase class C family)
VVNLLNRRYQTIVFTGLIGLCLTTSAWCQEVVAEIDSHIEKVRSQWQVPGLAVAIVKDNQVLLSKGYGVREDGTDKAVDQDTLFAIASNTKAFTSASLAILVDQGKLRWDDPVHQYLPWFRLSDPLATSDLRVRDLLCHRSGLGTFSGDLLWWGTSYSTREVLQRTSKLDLATPFRSQYGYSNLMFLAAGQVIEAVSGQTYADFVRQQILKPLGMDRTVMSVRDLISVGNFATPHKTYLNRSEPIEWTNWDNMAAGGGVISSAGDMAAWMKVQLREGQIRNQSSDQSSDQNAGESRLFSARQSWEMWEAQTPIPVSQAHTTRFPSTHFRAYGLGWSLADYQGRKTVGHGGGYDGMYSQVMLIPEEDLGIVVLTNSMSGIATPLTYDIVDLFLGVETKDGKAGDRSTESLESFRKSREAFENRIQLATTCVLASSDDPNVLGASPSHALEAYTGSFECPMYGAAEVVLEASGLVLKLLPNDQLVADLQHLHYDTFVVRWRKNFAWFETGTANFVSDARGVVQKIELDIPNDDMFFEELNLQRVPD